MRTTVDLDEDVLQAVKEIAEMRRMTMGQTLSKLVRKALEPKQKSGVRNGVPLFPYVPGRPLLTNAKVNELREDLEAEFGDLVFSRIPRSDDETAP
jgi:hypothetical protein